MRKLGVGVSVGILVLAAAASAGAATGGDSNAGDVWLDNVGQPAGPGHEMDPHLACTDINLWGAGLADGSGTFAIDGWPPSGSQEQDYSSTWSYSGTGTQVVAVINVSQLIKQAAANGDKPAAQGYHFKLDFSQDPQKHKTFWVNCPAPASSTTPAGSAPTGTSPTGTSPTGTTPTGSKTPSSTTSKSGSSKTRHSVKGKHRRRHRKLLKPRRHHRAPVRHVANQGSTTALFTG